MTMKNRIEEFEGELHNTKVNKATEHSVGLLKAKIARLKEKVASAKGPKTEGFAVRKSGNASVVLVGFPSVGKSTLLNKLTNAASKVAAYHFTTLKCIPGMMHYNHAAIQILDVPGIIAGAASGLGRGREVLAVVRNSDLVMLLADITDPSQVARLQKELYDDDIRLNQHKPEVIIKPDNKGGIKVASTVTLTKMSKEMIADVLKEFRIINATTIFREDIDVDQLIDVVSGNRTYIPAITVFSKADTVPPEQLKRVLAAYPGSIAISAEQDTNIELLKQRIYSALQFIRVFLKEVGKKPDMDEPLILREGTMVKDVCQSVHRRFLDTFRFARIWGVSAKFPGQKFKLDHLLKDTDILEIHTR